jgi:hypothetical protein
VEEAEQDTLLLTASLNRKWLDDKADDHDEVRHWRNIENDEKQKC